MALIEDIDTMKEFVPIEKSTTPATFLPDVIRAEETYILPALGQTVYDGLAGTLSTDQEALLQKVRLALAPLAMHNLFPKLNLRMSDKGLHTSESADKERALKWMVDDARNQFLIDGYQALDRLFLFLETQTDADWYSDWAASDAFTTYRQLFLNNASLCLEVQKSRWLFQQMLVNIRDTEALFIEPGIGTDFFTDLKTKFIDDNLGTDGQKVVEQIQRCISLFAYSKSLRDPNFLNELIIVTATRSDDLRKQENSLKNYESMADDYQNRANAMLNKLSKYLNENASPTLFITYYNSPEYKDPALDTNAPKIDNRTLNGSANGTFFM